MSVTPHLLHIFLHETALMRVSLLFGLNFAILYLYHYAISEALSFFENVSI